VLLNAACRNVLCKMQRIFCKKCNYNGLIVVIAISHCNLQEYEVCVVGFGSTSVPSAIGVVIKPTESFWT
jgi:hypothetical protein